MTLKQAKEMYYPEYRYAIVEAGRENYPLTLCKNIEQAKEEVANIFVYNGAKMYIKDLNLI